MPFSTLFTSVATRALLVGFYGFCAATGLFSSAMAADGFRFTDAKINETENTVELCLSFTQPLEPNRDEILSLITLEQGEKKAPLTTRDLSLSNTQLCLQHLQHERPYHLEISRLSSQDGDDLAKPINLDFTIPSRKPTLSFLPGTEAEHLPAKPPSLEVLNVKDVRFTLYRITNTALYAEAWRAYQQASLAPSESLVFAHDKGTFFWQNNLALPESPNQTQQIEAPLPDLQPGLYFLTAAPLAAPSGIEADPNLVAGVWFVHGALHLDAKTSPDGVHVFADLGTAPAAGVALEIFDKDNQVVSKAKTGADGIALLPLPSTNNTVPPLLIGTLKNGAVSLTPLVSTPQTKDMPSVRLEPDRKAYRYGETATILVDSRTDNGLAMKEEGTILRLIRPDQTVAFERPVPADRTGPQLLSLPLPEAGQHGDWTLTWTRNDGSRLAETPIKLSRHTEGPAIQVFPDRKQIDADGVVSFDIKLSGKTSAYQDGVVTWKATSLSYPGWSEYHFGVPHDRDLVATNQTSFITGAEGYAHLSLTLPPNEWGATELTFAAAGATPTTITLPLKQQSGEVGIKQLRSDKPNENIFSLIALDAAARRRAVGDIYYQIYEDGRNFEWYQAEGRWRFRPLPRHHRITGGHLSIAASGENTLSEKLSPGHYILEIADATGHVLARHAFQSKPRTEAAKDDDSSTLLKLVTPPSLLPNQTQRLTLTLAKPAAIHALIRNGKTHQIIHQVFPSGTNTIPLTPGADWGGYVSVKISALFADGKSNNKLITQERRIPLSHPEQELSLAAQTPKQLVAGQSVTVPVTIQNIKTPQPTYVTALLTPDPTLGSEPRTSVKVEGIVVDHDGKANISLPVPNFTGNATLTFTTWNDTQHGMRSLTLPTAPALVAKFDPPPKLMVGDHFQTTLRLLNKAAPEGEYRYNFSSPDNIKMIGKATDKFSVKHSQGFVTPVALYAQKPGSGSFVLDITGPDHFHFTQKWSTQTLSRATGALPTGASSTIAAKQSLTLPALSEDDRAMPALIGTAPFFSALRDLPALLAQTPFTTTEMTRWLGLTQLWQGPIMQTALLRPEALHDLRQKRMILMLQRQKPDGRFADLPDQDETAKDSDIPTTASALLLLNKETGEEETLAGSRALQWIQHRLENNWFEEKDRAAHALGFLTLARMGKSDLSALRYFADISKDKELSPVTMAQISLALSLNKDESAAFWRQRATESLSQLMAKNPTEAWETIAILAEDSNANKTGLIDEAQKLATISLASPASILRTAWFLNQTSLPWNVTVNGQNKKLDNILSLSATEARQQINLQNPNEQSLFAQRLATGKENATKDSSLPSVQQHLYQLDGGLLNDQDPLQKDAVYVLEFSGPYMGATTPLVVQSSGGAGLRPLLSSTIKAAALSQQYTWLGNSLTDWRTVTLDGDRVSFLLPPPAPSKQMDRWHVAYLVQAHRAGTFSLPPISFRATGSEQNITEPGQYQLTIK